jgi:hypothetical protein
VAVRKTLVGVLLAALVALAVAAPANAVRPKSGEWFSDPNDDSKLSSIQFKVNRSGKKLKKWTIYWRCGDLDGYHSFRNPPIPIGVRKGKFKLVGATEPPAGQSTKDFKLKGKFTSRKRGRYSMKLKTCGPKTTGKLAYVGD